MEEKHNDPLFDALIINLGAVDYADNVSDLDFKKRLNQLILQIKKDQKNAKILVVNKPKNTLSNMEFNRYAESIKEVVLAYNNVYYLSSDLITLSPDMWYASEPYHPKAEAYLKYVKFIEEYLDSFFYKKEM